MKRSLLILWILLLCLALCACGKASAPDVLPAGDFTPPVVPTPEPWSDAPDTAPVVSEPTPGPDNRNYREVIITAENWNQYFQLREIPLYSITNSGVIAQVYQTYCVVLRDEYLSEVKPDGDYSVSFSFNFDLYYNTLKVDTKSYTYGHTDDTMFEVNATKSAVYDKDALHYSAYGTDHSRYSGYSNAFFTGWANIHPDSKVWSGFYIDLSQVKLLSVEGSILLAE